MDLETFLEEVNANVSSGHQAFVAELNTVNASGSFSGAEMHRIRKQEMVRDAQQRLLAAGLNVRGIRENEWDYSVSFEIEVPAPVEATKHCPKCAEIIKAAAIVCRFCGADVANETASEVGTTDYDDQSEDTTTDDGLTQFDMSDVPGDLRAPLTQRLFSERIPYDWDGDVLTVDSNDRDRFNNIYDELERRRSG